MFSVLFLYQKYLYFVCLNRLSYRVKEVMLLGQRGYVEVLYYSLQSYKIYTFFTGIWKKIARYLGQKTCIKMCYITRIVKTSSNVSLIELDFPY